MSFTFSNIARTALVLLTLGAHPCGAQSMTAESGLWDEVRQGGYVLLVRHTAAPLGAVATGDGCPLERDPADAGQKRALRLGLVFRQQGIPVTRVVAGPACPSIQTARLAFGQAETWRDDEPDESLRQRRLRHASALTSRLPAEGNLVVVMDKLAIANLTERAVSVGEVLVLKPNGEQLDVRGLLTADLYGPQPLAVVQSSSRP